jgi:hypothetical protein
MQQSDLGGVAIAREKENEIGCANVAFYLALKKIFTTYNNNNKTFNPK